MEQGRHHRMPSLLEINPTISPGSQQIENSKRLFPLNQQTPSAEQTRQIQTETVSFHEQGSACPPDQIDLLSPDRTFLQLVLD